MAQQQMFGSFDPELVKQALAAQEEQNLMAQAKLSPAEVQRYVAASAGRQLGGIVGGIFGVEAQDPRLRQAQLAQESYQEALTATGGDANSPQFFQAFANSAARRNLPTLAQQATQQAIALQSEQSILSGRSAQEGLYAQQVEESKARTAKLDFAQQQEEKLRAELSTLPPNASEEQVLSIYRRYGSADQQSRAIQASLDRRARLAEASKMATPEFNNNGIPMGRVDAKGNFFDNSGRKVANKEFVDAEQSHNTAVDLLSSLRQISDKDIDAAFGSIADYTQSDTAKLVGSALAANTQKAQYKINQVGVRNILDNLQKLKGASTDKEMQKVASTFPGFQARPEVMKAWIDDAIETTNRFLARSEKRYGFDTVYEQENRFGTKTPRQPSAEEVPAPASGRWKILNVK